MKNLRVLMEEMNDGIVSGGMGGGSDVSVSTQTSEPVTTSTESSNGIMSEEDALSFLSGATEPQINQDANVNLSDTAIGNQEVTAIEPFDIGEIDMSMFGLPNEPQATAPVIPEQQQATPEQQQAQMLQDIYNKLNNPDVNNDEIGQEELTALSALTEKLQKAGLLPKGISEEDRQILQDAKTMRDEIKQQREQQAQQVEFGNKVSAIDSYSKQLEDLIPGYSTEFMISMVSQISQKNPQAGQQILNNPAMLTQLWATYGAKSQPKQQSTNVISNGSSQVGKTDLFEKVKGGNASIDDEARYLASL
jgi:hypothetical protein